MIFDLPTILLSCIRVPNDHTSQMFRIKANRYLFMGDIFQLDAAAASTATQAAAAEEDMSVAEAAEAEMCQRDCNSAEGGERRPEPIN